VSDALWRLAWALPMVLAIGVASVLVLRRWVVPHRQGEATGRLRVLESLPLSDDTRLYVIDVDRRPLLLVESSREITLQDVAAAAGAGMRHGPATGRAWIQRPWGVGR